MTTLSTELGADEPRLDAHALRPAAPAGIPSAFGVWPGLVLTASIAAMAFALRQIPYVSVLSPIILSIAIGMVFHNVVGTPALARPGVAFSMRRLLRFAIILLGLQLTASQLVEVGASGLAIIALTLTATFLFTVQLGRLIGVDRQLSELIAAGTSICGASAVIATNTVTRAPDEDVAYAVACVTVFGSIAMFAYPLFPGLLHLDPHAFGLWSGASIHEIAQVVAAAFQDGRDAGEFGTIAKLARVTMLAPVVMSLGFLATRQARRGGNGQSTARPPLPWFVLGFIALVGINSLISIPAEARSVIVTLTTFLLSMALAAMGLETDIRKLCAKGIRPLLLGTGAFLFISSFSLVLIKTLM
jgi:uncharacterized integral membrane protein (TIGR00698 family)